MAETPTEVAVARFDGEGTAVRSYAEAKERSRKEAPWMAKVGFVEHHHNGRLVLRGAFAGHYLDVDESDSVSQSGAAEGAVGGGLVGVLLGPPGMAVGLVLGGLIGAYGGHSPEVETEPDMLAGRLREAVPRSSSAVVLVAGATDVDEMVAALEGHADGLLRRTLTPHETAELEASLSSAP